MRLDGLRRKFPAYYLGCLRNCLHLHGLCQSTSVSSFDLIVSACILWVRAGGTALLPDAARWPDLGTDTARNVPSTRRRRMDGSDVGVEWYALNRLVLAPAEAR